VARIDNVSKENGSVALHLPLNDSSSSSGGGGGGGGSSSSSSIPCIKVLFVNQDK
jgi:hypothetical protein